MTPSGIEPATFRLVVQCLNQLRHRVNRPNNKGHWILNTDCLLVQHILLTLQSTDRISQYNGTDRPCANLIKSVKLLQRTISQWTSLCELHNFTPLPPTTTLPSLTCNAGSMHVRITFIISSTERGGLVHCCNLLHFDLSADESNRSATPEHCASNQTDPYTNSSGQRFLDLLALKNNNASSHPCSKSKTDILEPILDKY